MQCAARRRASSTTAAALANTAANANAIVAAITSAYATASFTVAVARARVSFYPDEDSRQSSRGDRTSRGERQSSRQSRMSVNDGSRTSRVQVSDRVTRMVEDKPESGGHEVVSAAQMGKGKLRI